MKRIYTTLKNLLPAALLLGSLSACTDVIDLDLDDTERVLVVDGHVLTSDSVQWLRLSYTYDYFADRQADYLAERNAQVLLYENNALKDTMEFNQNLQRFESAFVPAIGNSYYVLITTTDGVQYRSEPETIRPIGPIDTIYYEYVEENGFIDEGYDIFIEAQELPGIGDNYQWKSYVNEQYQDTPDDLTFASDEFVEGNYISEFDVYKLDIEDYDRFKRVDGSVNVRIEQIGITKNYRVFLEGLFEQTAIGGGPFSPPAAEVPGNVFVNGTRTRALGYFYAASVETRSVDLP